MSHGLAGGSQIEPLVLTLGPDKADDRRPAVADRAESPGRLKAEERVD